MSKIEVKFPIFVNNNDDNNYHLSIILNGKHNTIE